MLLEEKFLDICQTVLKLRSSKSTHVHFMLMEIIPRLAMFKTEIFIQVRAFVMKNIYILTNVVIYL